MERESWDKLLDLDPAKVTGLSGSRPRTEATELVKSGARRLEDHRARARPAPTRLPWTAC